MPFNRKALLSLLGVFRQRAVRESKASDGTLFIGFGSLAGKTCPNLRLRRSRKQKHGET
jgi:hypothetical protein